MSNQELITQWKKDNKTAPIEKRLEWLESYVSILLDLHDNDKKIFEYQSHENYRLDRRIAKLEVVI